jgi:uncharacterized membrane protein
VTGAPPGHHHHAHDELDGVTLTAGRARRRLAAVVGLLAALTLAGLAVLWPRGDPLLDTEAVGFGDRVRATVTSAETSSCSYDPESDCRVVVAELTTGPQEGGVARLETGTEVRGPAATLEAGDRIILNDAGPEVVDDSRYSFADLQRSTPLLVLAALFAGVVIVLGRLRGLLALCGVALSLGVLVVFVFPALLTGTAPLAVALVGTSVIAYGTLYLAHGVNERTTVALLGTLASLALTAVLAVAFAGAAQLSGVTSDESATLIAFAPDLDVRGLLLAAVIIGTLGVLDDVTVTQVAAVWELYRADPDQGRRQLFGAAIRIGRDHIASTVNTLVLAYAAAALPLMLLFTQSGLALGEVVTSETVAVEVVQTLVGSIGLVASVPLTTALAAWIVTLPEGRSERDRRTDGEAVPPGAERAEAGFTPWWEAPPPADRRTGRQPWTVPTDPPTGPQPHAPPPPDADDAFWRR